MVTADRIPSIDPWVLGQGRPFGIGGVRGGGGGDGGSDGGENDDEGDKEDESGKEFREHKD